MEFWLKKKIKHEKRAEKHKNIAQARLKIRELKKEIAICEQCKQEAIKDNEDVEYITYFSQHVKEKQHEIRGLKDSIIGYSPVKHNAIAVSVLVFIAAMAMFFLSMYASQQNITGLSIVAANFTADSGISSLLNNTVNDVFVDGTYYYAATGSGLSVLFVKNNTEKANLSGNFKAIYALNNLVYLGNTSGIYVFNNNATLGFNKSHTVNVTNVNDIDCTTFSGLDYCAIGTNAGLRVYNLTGNTVINSTDTQIIKAVKFDKNSTTGQVLFSNTTHLLRSTGINAMFNNEEYPVFSNISGWWHFYNADGNDSGPLNLDITLL